MFEKCMANCMANKIYTIAKVLESMMLLKQATNRPVYQNRKKQTIVNLLTNAGLSLEDDYFKFHNVEMIEKISKGIINNPSLKNDVKKMKQEDFCYSSREQLCHLLSKTSRQKLLSPLLFKCL